MSEHAIPPEAIKEMLDQHRITPEAAYSIVGDKEWRAMFGGSRIALAEFAILYHRSACK